MVPVPYNIDDGFPGRGPKGAFCDPEEASCNMELYEEELRTRSPKRELSTLAPLGGRGRLGPEGMLGRVEEAVAGVLEE